MRKAVFGSCPAVITIFFTLLITVFLALFFALCESVRIQGARAQAAGATDMANYSLFSEYEKQLLTDYELFGLDCSYGSGGFSLTQAETRFREFLKWNETTGSALEGLFVFDPWQIRLEDCEITKAALLSDRGGCGFYQQAVSFMKETALTGAAAKLASYYSDAKTLEELKETYEESKAEADAAKESADAGAEELIKEARKDGRKLKRPRDVTDPLRVLAKLVRKGIFASVLGDVEESNASVSGFALASHRMLHTGTLKLEKKHGGLADDLLFREYLLDHFPNFLDTAQSVEEAAANVLQYQAEYLIAGKKSDRQNLKSVVRSLVLLREGANYAYCAQDPQMAAETEALALLLMGWTGLPQLVEAVQQALLIGWAYGESLLDARTLLTGGRVPLWKDASSWQCSLDQLAELPQLLREDRDGVGSGLCYRDYLRLLLNLRSVSEQEKRGLDLIELNMRYREGFSNFRVDQCIVAVRDRADWTIPPVFFRVVQAFSGVAGDIWSTKAEAGFAYQ